MGKFKEDIAEEVVDLVADKAIGATFWRSSTVLAFGGNSTLELTQDVSRGDLVVEDIIIKTGEGIGGSGSLKIICNNAKGSVTILEENITRLGSSKTVDLAGLRLRELLNLQDDASTFDNDRSNTRTILEEGKRLEVELTGSPTGIGDFDVFIQFRRLAEYADVKILNK